MVPKSVGLEPMNFRCGCGQVSAETEPLAYSNRLSVHLSFCLPVRLSVHVRHTLQRPGESNVTVCYRSECGDLLDVNFYICFYAKYAYFSILQISMSCSVTFICRSFCIPIKLFCYLLFMFFSDNL